LPIRDFSATCRTRILPAVRERSPLALGHGTFPPHLRAICKGWNLLFHTSPSYSSGVADWLLSHELESGLCCLDLERDRWRQIEAVAPANVRGVELMNDRATSVAAFEKHGFRCGRPQPGDIRLEGNGALT
jgi:hypothetical protein